MKMVVGASDDLGSGHGRAEWFKYHGEGCVEELVSELMEFQIIDTLLVS